MENGNTIRNSNHRGISAVCGSSDSNNHNPAETMKGEPCPYKPVLCQEGLCIRCQIYAEVTYELLSL